MGGTEALLIPMAMGALSGGGSAVMGGLGSLMAPLMGGGAAAAGSGAGSLLGSGLTGALGSATGGGLGSFLPQLGTSALGGALQGGIGQGFNLLGGGGQTPMEPPDLSPPPPVQIPSSPQGFGSQFTGTLGPAAPAMDFNMNYRPPGFGNTGIMGNMPRLGGPGSSMSGVPSFYLRNYR